MSLAKYDHNQVQRLEDRLEQIELKCNQIEGNMKKVLNLSIGIAIGVIVGAVIFGIMSIKEFLQIVK